MLDSIREIFDILDYDFESFGFDYVEYKQFNDLVSAINEKQCPVVDVLGKYLDPKSNHGSHVMVATGIKTEDGTDLIQLKNSYADNPSEQGKIQTPIRMNP